MIRKDSYTLTARYYNGRAVAAVRRGAKIVWEALRSCFGKGWWINNQPWSEQEGWRNG